mgnify:CR=1 FL=1
MNATDSVPFRSLVLGTDFRLASESALEAAALLATLHTWLSCHGSTERTSTILGVHRNTVRHRLTQVATLLDADLQDPETRMTLWFALGWSGDGADRAGPGGIRPARP